ncbi:hypothetical protein FOL47_010909 [Perkinsus chesapeaki]|uniref:Gag/pol/env polyprotein n=1 Tax=Perkinsus chesapeaki TaxID=330153 RepID=A0A7J6KZN7_PERCH|nr:hypothetical protein FOL47_010909 [Perkinsus chesapeaki]
MRLSFTVVLSAQVFVEGWVSGLRLDLTNYLDTADEYCKSLCNSTGIDICAGVGSYCKDFDPPGTKLGVCQGLITASRSAKSEGRISAETKVHIANLMALLLQVSESVKDYTVFRITVSAFSIITLVLVRKIILAAGSGTGHPSHMVPDAGSLACLLGVDPGDLPYCSDQDLELVLSRFAVDEKTVGERVAYRKLLAQIRGKALGSVPLGEVAHTTSGSEAPSTDAARLSGIRGPSEDGGGQAGRPRAYSRLSNLLSEFSTGNGSSSLEVSKAMQGISHIPIPDNAEYQGGSDARPVTSWIRDMTLTSRVYDLSPPDIWRLLLRALSPDCRLKLMGHLEREGLLSANPARRLQEAEQFMLGAYHVTDDPIRFRNKLAAVTHKPGESVTAYTSRFQTVMEEGRSLGLSSTNEESLDLYRKNLTPRYLGLATSLYCGCDDIGSLSASLARWELVNVPGVVGVKALTLPAPDEQLAALGQGGESLRPRRVCWECKDPSHLRRDCPVYKKRLADELAVKGDGGGAARSAPQGASTAAPQGPTFKVVKFASPDPRVAVLTDVDALGSLNGAMDDAMVPLVLRTPDSECGAEIKVLLDSGASGCGFIDEQCFNEMVSAGVIPPSVNIAVSPPGGVRFGDGRFAEAKGVVHLDILSPSGESVTRSAPFKILPVLCPTVIIGAKLLGSSDELMRLLSARLRESSLQASAPIPFSDGACARVMTVDTAQVLVDVYSGRLRARCYPFEDAAVIPHAEAERKRSRSKQLLIHRRLEIAAREGKFERIRPEEALVVSEPVLCDKLGPSGPLPDVSVLDDEQIRKRWRLTLDCRTLNSYVLVDVEKTDGTTKRLWAPNSGGHPIVCEVKGHQFQRTALQILAAWPSSRRKHFARIDIRDAFSAVLRPPGTKGIFVTRSIGPDGVVYYWSAVGLVQGWYLSPLLFSRAIDRVLDDVDEALAEAGLAVRTAHFQDDLLLGAEDAESLAQAVSIVRKVLARYCLEVAEEKLELGTEAVFCGLVVRGNLVIPSAKNKLSDAAVELAISKLHAVQAEKELASFVRRWAGVFNWVRRWLPADAQLALAGLHSTKDLPSLEKHLRCLASFYFGGLAPLYIMGTDADFSVKGTVVLCDANKTGWGAMLAQVVCRPSRDDEDESYDPEHALCAASFRKAFDVTVKPGYTLQLLPFALEGGGFTARQQQKSSTYRERCALLSAVFKFTPLFLNPVAVFTDNFNSKLQWGHLEQDHVTNEHELRKVLTFHENVNAVLWLPRTQTAMVDAMARAAGNDDAALYDSTAGPFTIRGSMGDDEHRALQRFVEEELSDGDLEQVAVIAGADIEDNTATVDRDAALEALREAPGVDEICDHQKHCVECTSLSKKPGFELVGDVLVRRVRYDAKGRLMTQLVIPKSLRQSLVHYFHDKTHASGRQLRYLLQQWSFWPRMGTDTLRARKGCDICQRCSDDKVKVPYGTRRLRDSSASWVRVGVDCLHLNHSGSGGGVLLTATCYLTGYFDFEMVDGEPTSETVLEAFEVICFRNGCPRLGVISDGAKYFTSAAATEWAKHRMISWEYSLPNSPGCGGWWERRHRECNLALRKWALAHPGQAWQSRICLETVRWLVNHMEIGDTGYCPYLLHHGRLALQTGVGGIEPEAISGDVEFLHEVDDVISLAKSVTGERRRALARFVAIWLDMREKHWPTHSPEAFGKVKKGDLVLVFTHRPRKLDVSWRGPFPVIYRGRRFLGLQTPSGVEEHHLANCKPYVDAQEELQGGDLNDGEGEGFSRPQVDTPSGGDPPASVDSRPQADMPSGGDPPASVVPHGATAEESAGRPRKRKAALIAQRRLEMMMRDEVDSCPLRPHRVGPKRSRLGEGERLRAISLVGAR